MIQYIKSSDIATSVHITKLDNDEFGNQYLDFKFKTSDFGNAENMMTFISNYATSRGCSYAVRYHSEDAKEGYHQYRVVLVKED